MGIIEIEDKLADLAPGESKSLMSKKWKVWILCLGILFSLISVGSIYLRYLEKFKVDQLAALQMSIGAIILYVFLIPPVGMLLALLLAFVPIKGYTYKRKYWAFALCTILVLQLFASFMNVYTYFDNPSLGLRAIPLEE